MWYKRTPSTERMVSVTARRENSEDASNLWRDRVQKSFVPITSAELQLISYHLELKCFARTSAAVL